MESSAHEETIVSLVRLLRLNVQLENTTTSWDQQQLQTVLIALLEAFEMKLA